MTTGYISTFFTLTTGGGQFALYRAWFLVFMLTYETIYYMCHKNLGQVVKSKLIESGGKIKTY